MILCKEYVPVDLTQSEVGHRRVLMDEDHCTRLITSIKYQGFTKKSKITENSK